MARLNKTPLTLRLKRGTEAQITATSPAPFQREGEMAYATDTGGFYVSDGTQFILLANGLQDLQSVTDEGNTTTNDITVDGTFRAGSNLPSNSLTVNAVGATVISTTGGNEGLTVTDTSNGIFVIKGGSQSYRLLTLGGNQQLQIRDKTNSDATRLSIANTGNVLIGTTTDAGYKLDVNGSARVTGDLTVDTNTLFVDTTNDRVGINKTPTEDELEVDSSFRVGTSNGLRFRSSTLYIQGQVYTKSGAVVTKRTSGRTEWYKGNSGSDFMVFKGDACTNAGSFLEVHRDFTATGNESYNYLYISPTINQGISATGSARAIRISPTLTSAADWRSIEWSNNSGWGLYGVGTASNYLNGSLLIGTTTDAGYGLDVNSSGGVMFRNPSYSNSVISFKSTGNITAGMYISNTASFTRTANGGFAINDSQGGGARLTLFAGGSGTTSLYMYGNVGFSSGTKYILFNHGSVEQNLVLRNVGGGGQRFEVQGRGSFGSNYTSLSAPTDGLAIEGNTLIGTTTDAGYKLSVNGSVLISNSTPLYFSGANSRVTWGTGSLHFYYNGVADILTLSASTNVGIGTTSPVYKLDVNGDANITGSYHINGTAGWSGTITIASNPPGQQNIDVQGGIIVNVF